MMFRTRGIGDDESACPVGFSLTDAGCLPDSTPGCSYGYTEVNGECLPIPTTAPAYLPTTPITMPISIPMPTLPTPQSCPTGFTMTDVGCLPNSSPVVQQQQQKPVSSTIIPGVPNWMTYGIGVLAALTLFGSVGGRRR